MTPDTRARGYFASRYSSYGVAAPVFRTDSGRCRRLKRARAGHDGYRAYEFRRSHAYHALSYFLRYAVTKKDALERYKKLALTTMRSL